MDWCFGCSLQAHFGVEVGYYILLAAERDEWRAAETEFVDFESHQLLKEVVLWCRDLANRRLVFGPNRLADSRVSWPFFLS